ncbi:50S ribosomal protein L10 [Gammaproteobacteria bacterium]|nr:50S ribosomal protein L10 [Gammaproteobacteria bacterium]
MSLTLGQKQAVVEGARGLVENAGAMILAEYRGIPVSDMTALRRSAREQGVHIQVIKNTLTRRAIAGTPYDVLDDQLVGPLVVAVSEDPVAAAKVMDKAAGSYKAVVVKAGAMNGELLNEAGIAALAKLPGREELLSILVGTMQAPIVKAVRTMNEVPTSFVRALAAVRDQKDAA